MNSKETEMIVGLHPVRHALEAGNRPCRKIIVESSGNNRLRPILDLARDKGVPIETLSSGVFRKRFQSLNNQSVVGYFDRRPSQGLDELLELAGEHPAPVLVLLDELQDPQNLGAVLRSAEVLGLQGAVIPNRRSAPLNATVAKCASGALETLPIAVVTNLVRAVEQLKENGYWVVGLDMAGEADCASLDFNFPLALVLGGEEKGIRQLLRKSCDTLVRIPMEGQVESLNASAAAAIVFYEAVKNRNQ